MRAFNIAFSAIQGKIVDMSIYFLEADTLPFAEDQIEEERGFMFYEK
jgi:hypothetical protein